MTKAIQAILAVVLLAASLGTEVRAERVQLLANGSFDQGLAEWESRDTTIVPGFSGNGARLEKGGTLCQIVPVGPDYQFLGGEVLVNLDELRFGDGLQIWLNGGGGNNVFIYLRHFSMAATEDRGSAFEYAASDPFVLASNEWYSLRFLQSPLNETLQVTLFHANITGVTELATIRVDSLQPTGLTHFRLSWITGSETARNPSISSAVTVDGLSYFIEGGVSTPTVADATCLGLGPSGLFVTILAVVAAWLAIGAVVTLLFFLRERRMRQATSAPWTISME